LDSFVNVARFQLERDLSQGKKCARLQGMSTAGDRYAAGLRTVGTAQILNKPVTSFPGKSSVMTGDLRIVKDQVAVAATSKNKARK
jgi:hypothetical protein